MALSLVSNCCANVLSLTEEKLQSMSTDEIDMIIANLECIKKAVSEENTSNSDKEAVKSDKSNCSKVAIKDDRSNCNIVAVKGEISSYGKVAIYNGIFSYANDITKSLMQSLESMISGLSLLKGLKCNGIQDISFCRHALNILQNTVSLFNKIKESVLSNQEALSYANEIVANKRNIFKNVGDFLKSLSGTKIFIIAAAICFFATSLMLPGLFPFSTHMIALKISELGLNNVIHFLKKYEK